MVPMVDIVPVIATYIHYKIKQRSSISQKIINKVFKIFLDTQNIPLDKTKNVNDFICKYIRRYITSYKEGFWTRDFGEIMFQNI